MILKIVIFFFISISSILSFAQDSIQLTFIPIWNNATIVLQDSYATNEGQTIEIAQLKFYISNVHTSEPIKSSNYYLLDLTDKSSFTFTIPTENSGKLFFNLGIDSLTNMQGVQGGDLDPMNGMYWTWQSGYINLKLEGFYKKKNSEKEEFTFHLGGYSGNKNAIQAVQLDVKPKEKELRVYINLAKYFNAINITEQNTIMSPSKEAVSMSKTMAETFSAERK